MRGKRQSPAKQPSCIFSLAVLQGSSSQHRRMWIQPLSNKEDHLREERTGFPRYTASFYFFSTNEVEIKRNKAFTYVMAIPLLNFCSLPLPHALPHSKRIIIEESLAGKETERLSDLIKIYRGRISETDLTQIL